MTDSDIEREADLFGKYFLKKTPNAKSISLYGDAVKNHQELVSQSAKSLSFVLKYPWSLRLIDSGSAIVEPESELRKRLYTMFAILESSAEYHNYFLPQKRSLPYLIVIGLVGMGAVIRAIVGILILKVVVR